MGFNVPVGTDHKGNNTDNIAWQRCHDTFSRIDDTPLEVLAVDSQTELRPATSRLHHSDTLAKQRTEKKRTRMMADVFRRPSRSLDGADIDADGHDRASTTYLSAILGSGVGGGGAAGRDAPMRRCDGFSFSCFVWRLLVAWSLFVSTKKVLATKIKLKDRLDSLSLARKQSKMSKSHKLSQTTS